MHISPQAPLRWTLGLLMLGHGLQKATKRFGGSGIDATSAGFQRIGFGPGKLHARVAAGSEILTGASYLTGAAIPAGSAALTGTMAVAAARVHGPKGLWINKGGCEYNLLLMVIAFVLTAIGAGSPSPTTSNRFQMKGYRWAFAQLIIGLGSAMLLMRKNPKPTPTPTPTVATDQATVKS